MEIKKSQLSDLPKVHQLFCSYLKFYQQEVDQVRSWEFLRQRLAQNESAIFIAEVNEVACGFVQLYPCFSSLSQSHTWILNDLFVDSNLRKNGIGQKLIETAVAFTKQSGAAGLSLQTAIDNISAQKLYERLGWVKDVKYLTYSFTC